MVARSGRRWRALRVRLGHVRRPLLRYSRKFTGDGSRPPERPSWTTVAVAWAGALVALATLGGLAEISRAPLMMAPQGASAVLLFAQPDSSLTQPRNVILGHGVGALIGLLANLVLGDDWFSMALAVATTIAVTKVLRCLHPPAGATSIIACHASASWWFLITPVLSGSLLLVLFAALYNNAIEHRHYPRHWW